MRTNRRRRYRRSAISWCMSPASLNASPTAQKGTKSESGQSHKAMTKAEVIALLKQTLRTGQEMLGSLTDAQLLEQVKFPFGDRMVTRFTFWQGPLYQVRNHHGQLVVYQTPIPC